MEACRERAGVCPVVEPTSAHHEEDVVVAAEDRGRAREKHTLFQHAGSTL